MAKMAFSITIGGDDQPALIRAIDEARKALMDGRCHVGMCGCVDVVMGPSDNDTEAEFRRQYQAAHPQTSTPWTK